MKYLKDIVNMEQEFGIKFVKPNGDFMTFRNLIEWIISVAHESLPSTYVIRYKDMVCGHKVLTQLQKEGEWLEFEDEDYAWLTFIFDVCSGNKLGILTGYKVNTYLLSANGDKPNG